MSSVLGAAHRTRERSETSCHGGGRISSESTETSEKGVLPALNSGRFTHLQFSSLQHSLGLTGADGKDVTRPGRELWSRLEHRPDEARPE